MESKEWLIVKDSNISEDLLHKTQDLIPVHDGVNKDTRFCIYELGDKFVKLSWFLEYSRIESVQVKNK